MEKRTRKPLRLEGFDYRSNGAYFVTVCTAMRIDILGKIAVNAVGAGPRPARAPFGHACADRADAYVALSPAGQIVWDTWFDLPNHNGKIELGPFIVMPDHIHGIIFLSDRNAAAMDPRAGLGPAPTALPEIMRQLKSFSARKVNQLLDTPGRPLWQRGYYERVLRGEDDLNAAAAYIQNNPARWAEKCPYLTK